MPDMNNRISIIIPAAPVEPALDRLLEDLRGLDCEIIVSREGTRARSLNNGAARAKGRFLWFLHADSRVTADNIAALTRGLGAAPDALHYYDLAFDGGGLARLNAWAANRRARLGGMPYGDQGLCLAKDLFTVCGGYPEDAPYGEDLLFVRRARRAGIALHPLPSTLTTSARKYRQQGWLQLTILHQWRMFKLMRRPLT